MESTIKQSMTDARRQPQQQSPHESLAALIACSRGQNALQRRALQLARWQEAERAIESNQESMSSRERNVESLVSFSATTLFLSAVAQNDVLEAERLLSTSLVVIDSTNSDGLTALSQSCIDDNIVMTQFLLERGANVNCRDNEGWTPLHATASCGHRDLIALLLRFGADPRAVNCDGELAIDVSADDDIDVRSMLLEAMKLKTDEESNDDLIESELRELRRQELSAIENDVTKWIETGVCNAMNVIDSATRATIIHVCAAKGYDDVLTRVLTHFATNIDIEARDIDGWTALHASAYWQQCETFETLCRFGAECDARTPSGQTARDLCHENTRIIEILSETEKARLARHQTEQQSATLAPTLNATQSETQRRAHAKKVRETRRSTQGVRADDVEKARALIADSSEEQTIASNAELNTTDALTHASPQTEETAVVTRVVTPPESPPTPTIQLSLPRPQPLFIITKTPQNSTIRNHDNNDNNERIETNEELNEMKWNLKRINSNSEQIKTTNDVTINERINNNNNNNNNMSSMTDNTNTTQVSYSVSRRRRPKRERRSTGISDNNDSNNNNDNNDDNNDDDNNEDDINSESVVRVVLPSKQAVLVTTSVAPSRVNTIEERKREEAQQSSATVAAVARVVSPQSSIRSRSASTSTSRASSVDSSDNNALQTTMRGELDYKTLYYELLTKFDDLNNKLQEKEDFDRKRESEFGRERRSLQRRVSELEEELKSLESLRSENSRLRDENGALIRVISKLSK